MKLNKKVLAVSILTGVTIVCMGGCGWYFGYKLPKQKRMHAFTETVVAAVNVVYDEVFISDKVVEDMCHNQLIRPNSTYTLDEIIAAGYICKCTADTNRMNFAVGIIKLLQSGHEFDSEQMNNLKNMPEQTRLNMVGIGMSTCSADYENLGRDYFVKKYGVIK